MRKATSQKTYNGLTRVCGVIGNPIEHTLSPLIQNHMAQKLGVNLVYAPFHVQTGRLEDAVKGAFALDLEGLNITVPYKSEVMAYLKEIDPQAKAIGAVNTLVRLEDGYKGYNTDMPGLYRAMQEEGVEIAGKEVVILGAGGVARAVAMMLWEKGASDVFLLNRSWEKAQILADEINQMAGREFVKAYTMAEYKRLPDRKFLVIQATNVGMYPKVDEVVIEDPSFYEKVEVGYDLIFRPGETKFMKLVTENGGKAYNGARMLVYQGIIAFELWTGKTVDQSLAEETYQLMLDALKS